MLGLGPSRVQAWNSYTIYNLHHSREKASLYTPFQGWAYLGRHENLGNRGPHGPFRLCGGDSNSR